jgi:flagellar secretion chaperone FliS
MQNNPYQQYQKTQTETASKSQLVIMLYHGAIKFINKAVLYIGEGNVEEAHNSAVRAQDIVLELQSTLNMDAGPVSENLDRLYQYMLNRLLEANIHKDVTAFQEIADLLRELLPAWEEAVRVMERAAAGGDAPRTKAGEMQLSLR